VREDGNMFGNDRVVADVKTATEVEANPGCDDHVAADAALTVGDFGGDYCSFGNRRPSTDEYLSRMADYRSSLEHGTMPECCEIVASHPCRDAVAKALPANPQEQQRGPRQAAPSAVPNLSPSRWLAHLARFSASKAGCMKANMAST
jgi:hypothetical protein